jgi:hypothetical protein
MKRRWPKGAKRIEVAPFGVALWVITQMADAAAADEYLHGGERKWKLDGLEGYVVHEKHETAHDEIIVMVLMTSKPSTVVHECSHAADFALQIAGVREVDTELRAYLMSWLFERVTEVVDSQFAKGL